MKNCRFGIVLLKKDAERRVKIIDQSEILTNQPVLLDCGEIPWNFMINLRSDDSDHLFHPRMNLSSDPSDQIRMTHPTDGRYLTHLTDDG